jgi:hypothetical protein
MGVPVNDAPPFTMVTATEAVKTRNTQCTPLFTATLSDHEDLALELLRLPGQENLDLERDLGGYTLLIVAAARGMAGLVRELLGANCPGKSKA